MMLQLSSEVFCRLAEHFVCISDAVEDGWLLERKIVRDFERSDGEDVYLKKKITELKNDRCNAGSEDARDASEKYSNDSDSVGVEVWTWEYHIIYNRSYRSPVLYFNVTDSDGRLLTLDKLGVQVRNNFGVISQQMHPFLNYPFYYVHPCDAATNVDWYKLARENQVNGLATWLSAVGIIGVMRLSEQYTQSKFNYTDSIDRGDGDGSG